MGACFSLLGRSWYHGYNYAYALYDDTDHAHVTTAPSKPSAVVVPVNVLSTPTMMMMTPSTNPPPTDNSLTNHNTATSHSNPPSPLHTMGGPVLQSAARHNNVPGMIRAYYTYFFPYTALIQALEHCGPLRNREFAFTRGNHTFMRYMPCRDENVLRQTVLRVEAVRIDIGGVYSRPMAERPARPDSDSFRCLRRELTFDIDLTDYPAILATNRTDPSDAATFAHSWRFLYVAAVWVSAMLRDNFGFCNVLPVFSGRRGIHLWVTDPRATSMTMEGRSAVLDFLNPFNSQGLVTWTAAAHPCFQFAATWIQSGDGRHTFLSMAREQQWFAIHRLRETIFPVVMKPAVQEKISTAVLACRMQCARFSQRGDTHQYSHATDMMAAADDEGEAESEHMQTELVWNAIVDAIQTDGSRCSATQNPAVLRIILYLMFPRFDRNVTRGVAHLLKAPFSVHPATMYICVPFDCVKAREFDAIGAMTLHDLASESEHEARRKALLKQVLVFKRMLVWPQHSVSMHVKPVAGTNQSASATLRKRTQQKSIEDW